jgi:uncharacterized RDD family membrane protein YckC
MMPAAASPVPREARPYQGRSAGLVTRSGAGVVDGLVALLLLVLGVVGFNGLRFLLRPRGFEVTSMPPLSVVGVFLATLALYLAAAWALGGRTYGCHLMGVRVVDRHGRTPGAFLALARAVLYVVFPLGLLWCAAGGSRRSVQDLLLGTRVVYDWMPHQRDLPPVAMGAGHPT